MGFIRGLDSGKRKGENGSVVADAIWKVVWILGTGAGV